MGKKSLIFLVIFLVNSNLIYANLWDNLFFEKNLDIKVPDEFVLKAKPETQIGNLDLSLSVSSILKKLYLTVEVTSFSNTKALEVIVDSNKNLLTFHTLANSCTKIELNSQISMIFDDSSSLSNLAIMFLDREKEDGYIVVDMQEVFNSLNLPGDLYIYYDEKSNLKKIKIDIGENRAIEFDVTEIKRTKLTESNFSVPKSWECDDEKVKSLDDIRTEDFIGDGLITLQDLLKNFNDSGNGSNLLDLLKKIISNNSP